MTAGSCALLNIKGVPYPRLLPAIGKDAMAMMKFIGGDYPGTANWDTPPDEIEFVLDGVITRYERARVNADGVAEYRPVSEHAV